MTRTILPMAIADLSAFAKSLRGQIQTLDRTPSHVEMLNLLSRAAGFQNFQHFRARPPAELIIEPQYVMGEPEPDLLPDEARVMKTLRLFDRQGQLIRWPTKRAQQELCLWFLWSKIPRNRLYTEREISGFLTTLHTFGDAALLRRDLFDLGLVTRKRDGSDYRRVEKKPPAELSLLLRRIGVSPVASARPRTKRDAGMAAGAGPA